MALQLDQTGHPGLTGPAPEAYGVIGATEGTRRGIATREDGKTVRKTVAASVRVNIEWYSSRDWRDQGGKPFAIIAHDLDFDVDLPDDLAKLSLPDEMIVPMLYDAIRIGFYPDATSV